METICEHQIASKKITLKTGKLAKQANGSVVLQCGDTVLLATATMSKAPREGCDFFPLTIEYIEKMYASGKIPGGFFKRETKPSNSATLTARLIDRPIRPCFPKDFYYDVQVVVTVLSYDTTFPPEHLGIIAASAALSVSDIPFRGPIGGVLVGLADGKLVANPTQAEMEKSTLSLMLAGTQNEILMVEAGANEISEEQMLEAILFGQTYIRESIQLQEELTAKTGKEKITVLDRAVDAQLSQQINDFLGTKIEENLTSGNKQQISDFLDALSKEVAEKFLNEETANQNEIFYIFNALKKEKIRKTIISKKVRPDGRSLTEIRPIASEIGLLPSAHGSAVFTRGETQSLAVVTLGTSSDEQIEDGLQDTYRRAYYFHYNFPPFSVGETGFMGRTGRRELGHGALAERSLRPILPSSEDFPYTLRIVSEILESNGSSSMASVCAGSLSLMDCGVPIKAPVSGIAMGLLIDKNNEYVILSDIQGLEDHYGDMDFKVAGTDNGITALQLDIKVGGLSKEILQQALQQAKEGRKIIMNEMCKVIQAPREDLSDNAPKIVSINIPPDKVGTVIGPGGKMIRKIEEESGANITISDTIQGLVTISAKNSEGLNKAKNMVEMLVKEVEVGEVYEGRVTKVTNFGAFVELVPGKEGLVHISNLAEHRVNKVEDIVNLGDVITVKVRQIDNQNRINLTAVNVK